MFQEQISSLDIISNLNDNTNTRMALVAMIVRSRPVGSSGAWWDYFNSFAWQSATNSTPESAKRKRNSAGTPKTPQAIVPAGSNLTLLAQPKAHGGIVHRLQPVIIPEIIARFGYRWHLAAINNKLPPIIRAAVQRLNIGGYGDVYDTLRASDPGAEIKLVRNLRSSQAHAVKAHHDMVAMVIETLFIESRDPLSMAVKKRVFDVDDGEPILPEDHPVMIDLKRLSPGELVAGLPVPCF